MSKKPGFVAAAVATAAMAIGTPAALAQNELSTLPGGGLGGVTVLVGTILTDVGVLVDDLLGTLIPGVPVPTLPSLPGL